MKKHNIDKIKELHNESCPTIQEKIKNLFPDAFKVPTLEVGKWYKSDKNNLWFVTEFNNCGQEQVSYGINYKGEWVSSGKRYSTGLVLATEQEVRDALVEEAEKRGFKKGITVHSFVHDKPLKIKNADTIEFIGQGYQKLHFGNNGSFLAVVIYEKGKWAEIIKETTVTQSDLIEFYKKEKGIDNLKVIV